MGFLGRAVEEFVPVGSDDERVFRVGVVGKNDETHLAESSPSRGLAKLPMGISFIAIMVQFDSIHAVANATPATTRC